MKSKFKIPAEELSAQALSDDSISSAVDLFREHGALWLKEAIDPAFISQLLEAYLERYENLSLRELNSRFSKVGDQRYMISVKIKGVFNTPRLYANPILMPILQNLLGRCVISSFGSVVAFPGAEDQAIHFDHPPLFESEAECSQLPPYAITVVIPLVDIDYETGSTGIWEGTHKSKNARQLLQQLSENPTWEGSAQPLPRVGDVYLMDYRVIHGGMANQSQTIRPIFYSVYSRPWFRDASNFSDQTPVDLPKKQRKKIPKDWRYLFD